MSFPFLNFFKNPAWIDKDLLNINQFDDLPELYISQVRDRLKSVVSDEPVVSVILTTLNEETNVVRCLDSISRSKTSYPFEVVLVNNNSTDKTLAAYESLDVEYHNQTIQGSGPSRQMGIEHAKGKYILLGDADCLYPESWIQKMVDHLKKQGTSVVYGRYSYLADKQSGPRWQLSLYELLRDVSMEMRHAKRPFLNAYGISMAFYRDQALKEGFITDARRGNDGRMCFDLMKYGKVRRLRSYRAAAWTGTRTLMRDGSFLKALWRRVMIHLSRLDEYFRPLPDHDTKTSLNGDDSVKASIKRIKKKVTQSSTR